MLAGEEAGVSYHEQQVIDRDGPAEPWIAARDDAHNGGGTAPCALVDGRSDERAARASLRAQIARLERERSAIVAERFPHIPARPAPAATPGAGAGAPTLLDLGQLERVRDRLAADVQELRARAAARVAHERRARELLTQMRLDPGSYRFVRLPVKDLGQGGCGVWEVRPRLGLIGMLAGWWQLKLSSGCPLARGSRSTRGPGSRR